MTIHKIRIKTIEMNRSIGYS